MLAEGQVESVQGDRFGWVGFSSIQGNVGYPKLGRVGLGGVGAC